MRNKNIAAAGCFVFIFCLTFLMVTSSWANTDNHFLYPNTGYRFALTESELQATQTVLGIWNGTIGADRYYTVLCNMGYNLKGICDQLTNKDFTKCDTMLVVIREEIINKPFWTYRATYKLDYDPRQTLDIQGYSKIYDCSTVDGYVYT
jgi:hypothetical protein